MTTNQAAKAFTKEDLLLHLLNSSLENDMAEVESYNLPQGTQLALAALVATYKEHDALEAILRRKEVELAERESSLLNLLRRLP